MITEKRREKLLAAAAHQFKKQCRGSSAPAWKTGAELKTLHLLSKHLSAKASTVSRPLFP